MFAITARLFNATTECYRGIQWRLESLINNDGTLRAEALRSSQEDRRASACRVQRRRRLYQKRHLKSEFALLQT